MSKGFCFQIERIARILTNARSRQSWLLKRSPGGPYPRRCGANCEKNHIHQNLIRVFGREDACPVKAAGKGSDQGDAVMKARFARSAAPLGRAHRASMLRFLFTLLAMGSTFAQGTGQGTPEHRKACTPHYRLCAGEIPNARAITTCLRRQMRA